MTNPIPDVIDHLAGITPGSRLDAIRDNRAVARENAQRSYLALFEPADPASVTLEERLALAAFITALHRDETTSAFYRTRLEPIARDGLLATLDDEVRRGVTSGPYGDYPVGPLTAENVKGLVHQVSEANRRVLGLRLGAALEHAHLLVFRPRDASPSALQALLDAGWSTTDIVTVSQIVAFLSFQVRVVIGFRALAAAQLADAPYVAIPTSPAAVA